MENILVCDIGGTSSRFALFTRIEDNVAVFNSEIWEETNSYNSFEQLLAAVKSKNFHYDVAKYQKVVVAVPGPVTAGDLLCFPNVKWKISKAEISKHYPEATFAFINDFIAQAFGCLTDASAGAISIIERMTPRQSQNDIAIVGAGTGTGFGALKLFGGEYIPFPSEAGHAHFPFISTGELEFRDFLVAKNGNTYPVCNDVVSGQGLARLHHFLTGRDLSPAKVAMELAPESETSQWFSRFYARSCKNFCLTALAAGGQLFVSGGVAIKNPFLVDNDIFRNEFLDCSSRINLLNDISVSLVRNQRIGLYGGAYYAINAC